MNNMKYYPFNRNSYYTGKVWSAGDFESEQRYMNDKRRLQNRFAIGMGILCGLDVVALDNGQVSIEKGIALDGAGREIVLADAEVKRLAAIHGYEGRREDMVYYLYLSYLEKGAFQDNPAVRRNDQGNDKIQESYTFYLSENRPAYDTGDARYYYEEHQKVFENEAVRVVSITPKYIQAGEKFIYRLEIDTSGTKEQVLLQMQVALECVRYQGKDRIDIEFDSQKQKDQAGIYVLEYVCEGMNIVDDMARFVIAPEHFLLEEGKGSFKLGEMLEAQAAMTKTPVEECAIDDYKTCLMNHLEHNPALDICIARIKVTDGKIKSIDQVGRIRNLLSNESLALRQDILMDRLAVLEDGRNASVASNYELDERYMDYEIATGEVVISMGIGGEKGKTFYSDEIAHGLGLGNVTIILGQKNHADRDGSYIFGSSEVFEGAEVKAELAAKMNPAKGTFIIGARLLDFTSDYEIIIQWTAIKIRDRRGYETERKIIMDNSLKSMHVLESAYYSVKFVNMEKTDIRWSVIGNDAGSINESGCYTAPDHPGVFQIQAACIHEPQIRTSAFIVVKP